MRIPTQLIPLPSNLLVFLRHPPYSTASMRPRSSSTSVIVAHATTTSTSSTTTTTTTTIAKATTTTATTRENDRDDDDPHGGGGGGGKTVLPGSAVVHVRSALGSGPVPYEVGWAYQHVLLGRRLDRSRRRRRRRRRRLLRMTINPGSGRVVTAPADDENENDDDDDDDDDYDDENERDYLLLFEHEPTYTLGRGASVDHLTFLRDDDVVSSTTTTSRKSREDDRRRLGRDYRGIDASRLNVDRMHYSSSSSSSSSSSLECDDRPEGSIDVEDEVTLLLDDMRRLASSYPPVYAPNGSPVHRVERGGEVTFHGPGQLVMYPLLNLDANVRRRRSGASSRDLHGYLRDMEEVVIRTLMHYDVNSYRDPDRTGVWVNGMKIAASGVSCTRWITTHGLSLNVDVDLRYFDNDVVTPCGIGDRGVTSLARVLLGDKVDDDDDDVVVDECRDSTLRRRCPTVEEVGRVASECFGEVFGVDLIRGEEIRRGRG